MDLLIVARWIGYLGVMGLAGAATFQAIVHLRVVPHYPASRSPLLGRVRAAAFLAAFFVVASQVLKLLGQLQSFVEPGEAMTREIFDLVLFESSWGHSWQIQSVAAGLTLALIPLVRTTWLLVPLAIIAAAVAPLTGHAIEHPWGTSVGVALHTIHQLGGGAWIGTLFLVLASGYGGTRQMPAEVRHPLIARVVHSYSPVALAGVTTAIVAGLVLAVSYLDSVAELWNTGYGRALLVKILLLGGTAAIGAYNWRLVRPRLGQEESSTRLYRSATLELIIGALLLGATALLVAMPAPAIE